MCIICEYNHLKSAIYSMTSACCEYDCYMDIVRVDHDDWVCVPNVEKHMANCYSLLDKKFMTILGKLNTITHLKCCYRVVRLPSHELKVLKTLDIIDSPLEEVRDLPKLTKVIASAEASNVKSIRNLPMIKRLGHIILSGLQQIENVPNLETLNCSGCQIKKLLGPFPNLVWLVAHGCSQLEELPPHLPKIEVISIINSRLHTIPSYKSITEIYCIDCPLLENEGIPSGKTKVFHKCPNLFRDCI